MVLLEKVARCHAAIPFLGHNLQQHYKSLDTEGHILRPGYKKWVTMQPTPPMPPAWPPPTSRREWRHQCRTKVTLPFFISYRQHFKKDCRAFFKAGRNGPTFKWQKNTYIAHQDVRRRDRHIYGPQKSYFASGCHFARPFSSFAIKAWVRQHIYATRDMRQDDARVIDIDARAIYATTLIDKIWEAKRETTYARCRFCR